MNDTKVITPTGEIIGQLILQTDNSIILQTAQGRLTIDKGPGVSIQSFYDGAAAALGTIVKLNTIYGEAAYLKANEETWRLVWQSSLEGQDNIQLGNLFVSTGTVIGFVDLLDLYNQS